jgi:hypothetical protein
MAQQTAIFNIDIQAHKQHCVCEIVGDSVAFRPYRIEDCGASVDSNDFKAEDTNPDTFKPIKINQDEPRRDIPIETVSDARTVRDRFLSIGNVTDLNAFLTDFGCLDRHRRTGKLTLDKIRRWQAAIGWMLTHPNTAWGWLANVEGIKQARTPLMQFGEDVCSAVCSRREFPLTFMWVRDTPTLGGRLPKKPPFHPQPRVMAPDVIAAILATVYIDGASAREFALCARPDCAKPYLIRTKHKRIYCTQDCAHLEGLRRKRTLEKKHKRLSQKTRARPRG